MCGIAGIWNAHGAALKREALASLTDAMKHRGPDANGFFLDGDLGLGHRRLSIIDLAGSRQPMKAVGRELFISFNGEIYNYQSLRGELLALGHRFETNGDTEVILAAYAQWGADCLARLRGMFAFAIWDAQKRELFLARDRFGQKPLCIYQDEKRLAIASEIQAFRALEGMDKCLSMEALDLYLYYGYVPAPKSVFKSVTKLPPAHYCLLKSPQEKPQFVRYWSLHFAPNRGLSQEAWTEALAVKLRESVQSHLVSDVPVGAFLSGGIDSSAVVGSMCEMAQSPVHTYTIGFDHDAFDERPITRRSVEKIAVEHKESLLKLDVMNTLDVLVKHYGEPFADSSAVCTYQVTGAAAQDVKVMLSGDGGDEIFSGYSHYGWMLSEFLKQYTWSMRVRLGATDALRRMGAYPARMTPVDAWIGRNGYLNQAERSGLWQASYRGLPEGTQAYLEDRFSALRKVKANTLLDTIQGLDINDYLPYNNLHKVDIASMCHGLEVRVPLLDHELAEFAATMPWDVRLAASDSGRSAEARMHGFVHKCPLRRVAERTFGFGFFDRKKQGFTMPMGSILASDAYYPTLVEALTGKGSALSDYLRPEPLKQWLTEHRSGQRDHGLKLWSLLFLSRWLAQY